MKKKLMMLAVLGLTACNSPSAVTGADATTASSNSPAPAPSSNGPLISSSDTKTMLQTSGCTAAKAKGGANIQCADSSIAFIANGSPFRLQDADGSLVGDYLMSINSLSVWDATAQSAVNYDPNSGYVTLSIIYYESTDCSGQGYVHNVMMNTAIRDMNNTMYKVTGPITSVQYNSIGGYGGAACTTGNPGALVTSGTQNMAQAVAYPNTAMPVKINLPAAVVMANGGQ